MEQSLVNARHHCPDPATFRNPREDTGSYLCIWPFYLYIYLFIYLNSGKCDLIFQTKKVN